MTKAALDRAKRSWKKAFVIGSGGRPDVDLVEAEKFSKARDDEDPRPVIRIAGGELSRNVSQAEEVLIAAGEHIYQRDKKLVRPVTVTVDAMFGRKAKTVALVPVDPMYLRDRLTDLATWKQRGKDKKNKLIWKTINCPREVAQTLLARSGHWNALPLAGVIMCQTMRPDGSLLLEPGYDPVTRLLLIDLPVLPSIPKKPSKKDATKALAVLMPLYREFPFLDGVSLSVALSGLITPIVRGCFDLHPMHSVNASAAGSGKSFLWDMPGVVCLGHRMPCVAASMDPNETEKRISAAAFSALPLFSLDNINGELNSDSLSQLLSQPITLLRIFGDNSKLVPIEARGTSIYSTGNNTQITGDLYRRVLRAILDPKTERPEQRKFKRNPLRLISANRGKYIAAALTICRAYVVAGHPGKLDPLNGFEQWSDTVRSPLVWLGLEDPVKSQDAIRREDQDNIKLAMLLTAWLKHFGSKPVKLSQVHKKAFQKYGCGDPIHDDLHTAVNQIIGWKTSPSVMPLTAWLTKRNGKIIDGLRAIRETTRDHSFWHVENIKERRTKKQ
jgi:hypothetical protein